MTVTFCGFICWSPVERVPWRGQFGFLCGLQTNGADKDLVLADAIFRWRTFDRQGPCSDGRGPALSLGALKVRQTSGVVIVEAAQRGHESGRRGAGGRTLPAAHRQIGHAAYQFPHWALCFYSAISPVSIMHTKVRSRSAGCSLDVWGPISPASLLWISAQQSRTRGWDFAFKRCLENVKIFCTFAQSA